MKLYLSLVTTALAWSVPFTATSPARAVVNPGDLYNNAQSSLAAPFFTEGAINVATAYTNLVASMQSSFADFGLDNYRGMAFSRVWSNPAGELAFEYWFTIDSTSPASTPVLHATIGGDWSGATVYEVGSDETGSATFGGWPDNDADPRQLGLGMFSGSPQIEFFGGGEGVGFLPAAGTDTSAHFWYTTDARTYSVDFLGVLDGGLVDSARVFVVPAPGAVILGALGLGLTGWLKRRAS